MPASHSLLFLGNHNDWLSHFSDSINFLRKFSFIPLLIFAESVVSIGVLNLVYTSKHPQTCKVKFVSLLEFHSTPGASDDSEMQFFLESQDKYFVYISSQL